MKRTFLTLLIGLLAGCQSTREKPLEERTIEEIELTKDDYRTIIETLYWPYYPPFYEPRK